MVSRCGHRGSGLRSSTQSTSTSTLPQRFNSLTLRVDLQCPVGPYLVRDLDEQEEDDEHKQVASDADSSDDDVDDLECEVTDVRQI